MPAFKVAVLIDGGFLRVVSKKTKKTYDPDFIERFAHACKSADEDLFRVLDYDCALYEGTVKLPVSGNSQTFTAMMRGFTLCLTRTCLLCAMGVAEVPRVQAPKDPGCKHTSD